ncbi:hypothetical protein JJB07_13735 [Tumebacillus sp. ITR2]|uniref:Butirosin biosynthesis protein H N-terminal domain-containing protein n=1 Tax=Tumebacillus amylolyticus TaxID=2801339 RepID=A0ABS1JBP1_9BACL|nr:hypothetical protein [Tumebacillus amylolyticus]MBL0387697.1 hypothetical protein [Tumebacillus amylolyticus]
MSIVLPTYIYNDFFVNCLDNHLLGLLIQRDESFRKAVCSLKTSYAVHTPKPGAVIPAEYHQQGYFLMQIDFDRLELDDWFEIQIVEMSEHRDIHDAIQAQLKQGYYCLVFLDRFHFPGGIEYQKRHTVHPSFIYGYNSVTRNYLLVEDCRQFGRMEAYELSRENLEIAYQGVEEQNLSLKPSAFRLRNDRDFVYQLPRQALVDNFNYLLQETVEEQELLVKHTGLSCIETFAPRVGDVYTGLGDAFIHQFIAAGRPLQVQRKNFMILEALDPSRHVEQLGRELQELAGHWELCRNRLFKYILTRDRYPETADSSVNFDELTNVLHTIFPLEQRFTRKLIELLHEKNTSLV